MSVDELEQVEKVAKIQLKKKPRSKKKKTKVVGEVLSSDDEPLAQVLQQHQQIHQQTQMQTFYQQPLLVFPHQGQAKIPQFHQQVRDLPVQRHSIDMTREKKLSRRSTTISDDRMRKSRQSQDTKSVALSKASSNSSKGTLVYRKSLDSRKHSPPRSSISNDQQRKTLVRPETPAVKVQNTNALSRKSTLKKQRPRSVFESTANPDRDRTLRTSKSFDQHRPSFNIKNPEAGGYEDPAKPKISFFRRIFNAFKTKPSQEHKPIRYEDLKLPEIEITSLDSELKSGDGAKSDYFGDFGFDDIMFKYGSNLDQVKRPDEVRRKSRKERAPSSDTDVDPQLAALYSSLSF
jgi:hypothetical protein